MIILFFLLSKTYCIFALVITQPNTIMIYRFSFKSDEVDNFKRVFEADADATFLDLHNAILKAAGYPDDQMTSFFLCNDRWEKEQEVTLVEMGNSFEYDNLIMADTRLSDLLTEPKQRLIYIFDPMFERYFTGRLTEIIPGKHLDEVECVEKTGKAPKQLQTEDNFAAANTKDIDLDDDFFGTNEFDADELDLDGFSDVSFEDGTMF